MSKQPNPAREAARKLAGQIARMSADQRAAAAPHLPICSIEGRPFSDTNTILIATQLGNASVVGGFRQWKSAGRTVRAGEHGLWIWVPTTVKGKAVNFVTGEQSTTEIEETRFIMAPVFDVSQTDEITAEAA